MNGDFPIIRGSAGSFPPPRDIELPKAIASSDLLSSASNSPVFSLDLPSSNLTPPERPIDADDGELRNAFNEFVGQTFFGSMMASMRKSVGKSAYMHGGRGEEVFQKQLDEQLVQELTKSSAAEFGDPMFELFQLQRR
jgi:peptidoglycan hydrolase FlgJ